jgi:hypothetical protein
MKRRSAVESFGHAGSCLGPVEPGMSVFAITRGQFSMLDALLWVLAGTGPAAVSIWTWAVADYEVEAMGGVIARQEITAGRLIVDHSADKRNPAIIQKWRERFGEDSVRVCLNHAKIARVWNDRFKVLLRGSMNLNFNPRFEQLDVTEGGPDFDLCTRIEDEIPMLRRKYSYTEVAAASRIDGGFQTQSFLGLKPWNGKQ